MFYLYYDLLFAYTECHDYEISACLLTSNKQLSWNQNSNINNAAPSNSSYVVFNTCVLNSKSILGKILKSHEWDWTLKKWPLNFWNTTCQ